MFNQPVNFDTSKVTTMYAMFQVCSARTLGPTAFSQTLPVHVPLAPPLPHALRASRPASYAVFRLGRTRRRSTSR